MPKATVDHDLIRELAQLLDETGLSEIEIEQEGLRVRVGRNAQASFVSASAHAPPPPLVAPAPTVLDVPGDPTKHPARGRTSTSARWSRPATRC